MKLKLLVTLIGLVIGHNSIAQSKLDSLIQLRKIDLLEGKLPTYYTSGHKEIAQEFQNIISEAINYYEMKYSKTFQVKLVVLDSTQWLHEIYPYGFVFYSSNWIVMNTGMDYDSFKKVYGVQSYHKQLEMELKKTKISASEMIISFFKVISIHELGHYFIEKLSDTKPPDNWTSEFIATYFSYEFFLNKQPKDFKAYELFFKLVKDYYSPKYSSIKDFNQKYAGVGLENYLWYHSNFNFLVKTLYKCQGKNFISTFELKFPKSTTNKLSTDEIINILDKNCKGQVRQWVTNLEATTK